MCLSEHCTSIPILLSRLITVTIESLIFLMRDVYNSERTSLTNNVGTFVVLKHIITEECSMNSLTLQKTPLLRCSPEYVSDIIQSQSHSQSIHVIVSFHVLKANRASARWKWAHLWKHAPQEPFGDLGTVNSLHSRQFIANIVCKVHVSIIIVHVHIILATCIHWKL